MTTFKELIKEEIKKEYFKNLVEFLNSRQKANAVIFPKKEEVFRAFELCEFQDVKVVIVGQDPYHTKGFAHGLAFSTLGSVIPKSLINIFQNIKKDYPNCQFKNGNLENWAKQGVLLLNPILTVEEGKPSSHKNQGWEIFTKAMIQALVKEKQDIIFVLLGSQAKNFVEDIDLSKQFVLISSHPSPLSVHRGFKDSTIFWDINQKLKQLNKQEIDWSIE